jgi:hypothetical protein
MDAVDKPQYRPRHVVVRLVGSPGVGKTAIVEDFCRRQKIDYVKLDAQVTDVAEVFGLSTIVDGKTQIAMPSWWPAEGTTGIICVDDMSRALPHIQQALQQFVMERSFNGAVLPNTWSIVITDNPDTSDYNVSSLDKAQTSRMLSVAYNVNRDVELEQMEIQDVHDDLKNFYIANPDTMVTTRVTVPQPDNNPRMRMIFARLYPYIKADNVLLDVVGTATFGAEWVATFKAFLNTEQPLNPVDILSGEDEMFDTIERWMSTGKNSLVSASVQKLLLHLKQMTAITKEQFSRVADFLLTIPPESASKLVVSMIDSNTDFGKRFQPLVLSHGGLKQTFREKLSRVRAEIG